MKTVIVTPDTVGPIKNGGIGTFSYNFAKLLRRSGYDASILFSSTYTYAPSEWMHLYDDEDVEFILTPQPDLNVQGHGYEWFIKLSESVAAAIPQDTDILYFQDWRANGFHTLRSRRYAPHKWPTCVTVLHSSHHWAQSGMRQFPKWTAYDAALRFAESYVARYSDFALSPSQYMLDWCEEHGWQLPPPERQRGLGLPFFPLEHESESENSKTSMHFKHLIFFGRLETRKGLEVFIEALEILCRRQHVDLQQIEQIILLGKLDQNTIGNADDLVARIQSMHSWRATVLTDLDTLQAQKYLAGQAADSLVVIPSLVDNHPFAVIEVSLIPNLNALYSNAGGILEILGDDYAEQFFTPHPIPLAEKLERWLGTAPRQHDNLGHYNWKDRNQRWLNFHEELIDFTIKRQLLVKTIHPVSPLHTGSADSGLQIEALPEVDVCVPYYNLPQYLPQLLASLECQTYPNFNVYVADDGSTDDEAIVVFEQMKEKYAARGWVFYRKENGYLGQTRNSLASKGRGKYLIFMDADNVATVTMIERFVQCVEMSEDDCLTSYMYIFEGDDPPYQYIRGQILNRIPVQVFFVPVGDSLEAGLFKNVWGDANMIISRKAFEEIGGFTEDRYVGFEDYELFVRLSLNGHKIDVIPEYLFYYRQRADGMLRTTNNYANQMRVLRQYQKKFKEINMFFLPELAFGRDYHAGHLEYLVTTASTRPVRLVQDDAEWVSKYVPFRLVVTGLLIKCIDVLIRTKGSLVATEHRTDRRQQSHQIAEDATFSTLLNGLRKKFRNKVGLNR